MIQLGYFTHPTGFLSAALQTAARKSNIAVDALCWESVVVQLDEDGHMPTGPMEGLLLNGLLLEGARYVKTGVVVFFYVIPCYYLHSAHYQHPFSMVPPLAGTARPIP